MSSHFQDHRPEAFSYGASVPGAFHLPCPTTQARIASTAAQIDMSHARRASNASACAQSPYTQASQSPPFASSHPGSPSSSSGGEPSAGNYDATSASPFYPPAELLSPLSSFQDLAAMTLEEDVKPGAAPHSDTPFAGPLGAQAPSAYGEADPLAYQRLAAQNQQLARENQQLRAQLAAGGALPPPDWPQRTMARTRMLCAPNRAGNSLCAWHDSRRERRQYAPRNAPPGRLNCGCAEEEALFEESLARNGIGSYRPAGDSVRMDPNLRRPLLDLLKRRYGYKDGDFEIDPATGTWYHGQEGSTWDQTLRASGKNKP